MLDSRATFVAAYHPQGAKLLLRILSIGAMKRNARVSGGSDGLVPATGCLWQRDPDYIAVLDRHCYTIPV